MLLGEPLRAWAQMLLLLRDMLRLGGGTTFTVAMVVAVHPSSVPVSVYTVLTEGEAATLCKVVDDRPWEGAQLNKVAVPEEFNTTVLVYKQILALPGVITTSGPEGWAITNACVKVQAVSASVTVTLQVPVLKLTGLGTVYVFIPLLQA